MTDKLLAIEIKKLPSTGRPPLLIGIHGKAGAGKDTLASILCAKSDPRCEVFHFAWPLKRVVSAIYELDMYHLEDREAKEKTLERLGKSPRQIMQYVGTEVMREHLGETVFLNAMSHRIAKHPDARVIIIPDTRFPNELEYIRDNGGITVKVTRPDALRQGTVHSSHATEREIPDEEFDYIFTNDGDLSELEKKVMKFANEIKLETH